MSIFEIELIFSTKKIKKSLKKTFLGAKNQLESMITEFSNLSLT